MKKNSYSVLQKLFPPIIFFGILTMNAHSATILGSGIHLGVQDGDVSSTISIDEFNLNGSGPKILGPSNTILGATASLSLGTGETVIQVWFQLSDTTHPGGPIKYTSIIPLYSGSNTPEEGPGVITFDSALPDPSGNINSNELHPANRVQYLEISFFSETNLGTFVDDNFGAHYIAVPEPQSLLFCMLPLSFLTLRNRR
ncbi:MAG: hypothetical protein ACSHYF_12225 [Verrucomicrobiaceae bacterium]